MIQFMACKVIRCYISKQVWYIAVFCAFLETLQFFITINEKIIIKSKILNGCIK